MNYTAATFPKPWNGSTRVVKPGNRHNFPTKKPWHRQQTYQPEAVLLRKQRAA